VNKTLIATTAASAATAAVGALATRSGSRWYQRLSKPSWQPPAQVFPLVWNPLYALIAYGGARALTSAEGADRTAGLLLAPYAAWTGFATALNASIVRKNS
jgi:tryptophan-rich sensory protein